MKRFLFVIAALGCAQLAQANQYEQFFVTCDVTGTQQTLWTSEVALPKTIELRVETAALTKDCSGSWYYCGREVVATRSTFVPQGTGAGLGVAGEYYATRCNSSDVSVVKLGLTNLTPVTVRDLLVALGAQNVPDLAPALGPQALNASVEMIAGFDECAGRSYTQRQIQVHFPATQYDGLSYHVYLGNCRGKFLRPAGDASRIGNGAEHAQPAVPGRRGD